MTEDGILSQALNNQIRRQYQLNVLFAGLDKAPTLPWTKWQTCDQTDGDICGYFDAMGSSNVTCWGFVCGFRQHQTGQKTRKGMS